MWYLGHTYYKKMIHRLSDIPILTGHSVVFLASLLWPSFIRAPEDSFLCWFLLGPSLFCPGMLWALRSPWALWSFYFSVRLESPHISLGFSSALPHSVLLVGPELVKTQPLVLRTKANDSDINDGNTLLFARHCPRLCRC